MKRIFQDTLDALEKKEQSGKIEIDIYMRAAEELQALTRKDIEKIVLAN